ncbi:MAG: class I tRNA ligase family protein [Thermoplasmata archaeon]|nr:class I tRNA ligase family protein [Thermoplasmata archaeon]
MERGRDRAWQSEWARARVAEAKVDGTREKYYAIVAYPGSSGFLHLGHLRGMTLADALHRYHRMRGRAVFFPTGTHASGLPAVTFAQKVREREARTVAALKTQGIPPEEWSGLEEPVAAAQFLGRRYLDVYRSFGMLLDERAYVTTVDPDYQAFIRWQFHRLHEAGALRQGPHYAAVCPVCGPVSVDASETDLSRGGEAETVVYTTIPFALDDGRILLAATLRPETVHGATNLWLPPSGGLAVWHHGEASYLVSAPAAHRLVDQHGGHVGHVVDVAELIGRSVLAPVTGAKLSLLASTFVDPARGTGVVMSVPAHAPADWLAVQELDEATRSRLPNITAVVDLPAPEMLSGSERELLAGDGVPALRAVRAAGATRLADREPLEAATERLYRLEFVRGRMRPDLEGGRPVSEARLAVAQRLQSTGQSFDLREFSEPVVCRNGHDVVIRLVPDQWFLRYGWGEWKERTRALIERLRVVPEEYGRELPSILDWYQDRPCTRRGRWLGTPFPFDPSWVIEPIADSTFYPAYFIVRPFVADGRVAVDQLTDAFFDYVLLGRGVGEPGISPALQNEVRSAVDYWYPLDLNIGGKEHKRVHFPVFLATHALLLPPERQPRGVFAHWWLVNKAGDKVSKKDIGSKGVAVPPIPESLERWGADALRLFYVQAANPEQDIEWSPELVDAARTRVDDVERLLRDSLLEGGGGPPELDRWLAGAVHLLLADVSRAFDDLRLRGAAELVYGRLPGLIRRYQSRGGTAGPALQKVALAAVRLLGPITPHLAEELGAGRFRGLVCLQPFPTAEEFARDDAAMAAEAYLEQIEEDLRPIVRMAVDRGEPPEGVVFFVAAGWKAAVEGWTRDALAHDPKAVPIPAVLARAGEHPEMAAYRGEVAKYVGRIVTAVRNEPEPSRPVHELGTLRGAEGYLARRYGLSAVAVTREEEGSELDPLKRRDRARPGRPAFFLYGAKGPKPTSGPSAGSSGTSGTGSGAG